MALIVEDGTAKSDAESYASVAYADTYFASRGVTSWASLTTASKEIALRVATDYMTQTYRMRWKGSRYTVEQRLDWPRGDVPIPDSPFGYRGHPSYYGYTSVPSEVVAACCELAIRASRGELLVDVESDISSVSVGGAVSVTYEPNAREQTKFEAVERILAPLLRSTAHSIALERA